MRNKRILVLVEIALAVALSAVLSFWEITLPVNINGGSISLEMLPVIIVALRRGALPGLIAGGLYGCLDLITGQAYILHWAQVLLDYPLPYLFLGLGVGLFSNLYLKNAGSHNGAKATAVTVGAIIVGVFLRFIAHVLSGVIFFSEYAGDQNPWIYSIIYNVSYLLPSLIVVLVCAIVILPALQRALPAESRSDELSAEGTEAAA